MSAGVPPEHAVGIADGSIAYADQLGVGTAVPTHDNRVSDPGSPVETDGSASSVASTMFLNSPTPPRKILPVPFCHVNPSRGLRSTLLGPRSVRRPKFE